MSTMLQWYNTVVVPGTDDEYDIGSISLQFKNIFIDGSAYIDGLAEDMLVAAGIDIQFRSSATYITSDATTYLDFYGTYFDFNAPTNTDITLNFTATTYSGVLKWMEDEDYFKFNDDIMLTGGENIILDTATGTKIGTSTSQLLGFYNANPVNQPDTVADVVTQDLTIESSEDAASRWRTEADLTACKTAINAIIDRLQELGLIA